MAGPTVQDARWQVQLEYNPVFQEAQSIRRGGALTLPERHRDTAIYDGRIHSVHPPLFMRIGLAGLALGWVQGLGDAAIYAPWYVMTVALPSGIGVSRDTFRGCVAVKCHRMESQD